MIVYHGSTQIVEKPDVEHSLRPLDFGKAFYVTSIEEQAVRWARRKAVLLGSTKAFVNRYCFAEDYDGLVIKKFDDNLEEWIDFVIACRNGSDVYKKYDVIIGKVANDKVFRVVDMYRMGIWDRARALEEIRVYPDYDQIALISQRALNQLVRFESSSEVF